MTLLEEIYCDIVFTIAAAGGDKNHSLAANQLRAIKNRLENKISPSVIAEANRKTSDFVKMQDNCYFCNRTAEQI